MFTPLPLGEGYGGGSGTVGAWRHRGYLRVLLMLLSTSFQSSGLQDFLKRFLPKLSATHTLRLCHSLCLRHLREIVCFHLRILPLSVCLLYVVGLIYHSIFRKNHNYSLNKNMGKTVNYLSYHHPLILKIISI